MCCHVCHRLPGSGKLNKSSNAIRLGSARLKRSWKVHNDLTDGSRELGGEEGSESNLKECEELSS